MDKWQQTHPARPIPAHYATWERLPSETPIVGDAISYVSPLGVYLRPEEALTRLRQGRTVLYETYELVES